MRVLLADDHTMFRKGVQAALSGAPEITIVAEAADGQEAVELAVRHRPDLVLMDINMPVMNGVAATRWIKQRVPETRIVMLTVSDTDRDLFEAIKAGADGYLLKNLGPEELVAAVRAAAAGEAPISPLMAAKMLKEFREGRVGTAPAEAHPLTPRELEVLQLASQGLTYKEIAARLYVAESTVKNHMRHIMEKLHLRNRSEAIRFAFREGLVSEVDDRNP
ncbi:MAG: response regulator transcription factor [Firmicutes bacterium]|nr:response regulator transcription factor [Bacillota bacterium]